MSNQISQRSLRGSQVPEMSRINKHSEMSDYNKIDHTAKKLWAHPDNKHW